MRKLAHYILVLILSVFVVQAGVGISVLHHCCAGEDVAQEPACRHDCNQCRSTIHGHGSNNSHCGDDSGCRAYVYQEVLAKHVPDSKVPHPSCHVLSAVVPSFLSEQNVRKLFPQCWEWYYDAVPTRGARWFLALFSTLLI